MDDERLAKGIDHLQVAAQELIAAARAFLDVIEDVVADKERVSAAVDAVGAFARGAARAAAEGAGFGDDDPAGGIERITID